MHARNLHLWKHGHSFDQDKKRAGEARTLLVIGITASMMFVEITAGILFGSMALLADGLHMASHAAALSITAFAYIYARRHAFDERFSFGTGKVNALGGFTGAVLLAVFAAIMAWESVHRLVNPVSIAFNQAILVAIVGLLVNGASVFILGVRHDHEHGHHHDNHHVNHDKADHSDHTPGDHDHNLRAAYFHVLADALTSLLAIFALLVGKYAGLIWMDPVMGIVGAVLVARWSLGLLRGTSSILLDRQGPPQIAEAIKNGIERHDDNRVADLHLWSVGPNIYAAIVSVVSHESKSPDYYKRMIPRGIGILHMTVEVHCCPGEHDDVDPPTEFGGSAHHTESH